MAKINDILNEDWSVHDHGEVEEALKQKLSEMEDDIESAGQVNEIVMNGEHYSPTNKVIDLGNVTGTKGDKGDKGDDGDDGASAYEVAVAEGFEGDESAWLASLKGAKGDKGDTGADGADGADGTDGADGADGKSAYQCYYDTTTDNPKMTEAQWLASLNGADGSQGPKGDKGDTLIVDGDFNPVTDIVNDLSTGGTTKALSAEMGKRLALKAGTYAGAWARSKAVIVPFCWLWTETVGGAAICKPIWHIGNSVFVDAAGGVVSVQASAIPAAPTFSETSGSTVGKGTELTITPYVDSALYYKIGNGNWIVSDTAVTIEITATTTITAKCVNNAGSSSEVQCALTVSGPQTPSFEAAQGTTIASGDVVSRGGSVVVSVPQGGELHYSTDGTNYTTASGLSVTIPVPAAGVHIYAYNVQDGDQSATVDHDYTMAALVAPIFSKASGSELVAGGETVMISNIPTGAVAYFNITTDGTEPATPTNASTEYSNGILVAQDSKIKAVIKDDYGYSDATLVSYTVIVDHKLQFKIKLTGDNSTEYFPVTQNNSPLYHFTIDWGDGTTDTIGSASNPVYKTKKTVSHQYTGLAGDEFTVTVRGTALPVLDFSDNSLWNRAALYKILENSLTCDSQIFLSGCSNLAEISADAFQNNIRTSAGLSGTALTSIPDGLLSHLTKSGVALTSCYGFFQNTAITITASQMNELKAVIGAVTNFTYMFYSFTGSATIPDDFFDGVANDSVTDVSNMCAPRYGTKCLVVGNAETLYNVLKDKVTSSAATSNALVCDSVYPSGNSRSNVPSSWGGSGS